MQTKDGFEIKKNRQYFIIDKYNLKINKSKCTYIGDFNYWSKKHEKMYCQFSYGKANKYFEKDLSVIYRNLENAKKALIKLTKCKLSKVKNLKNNELELMNCY